MIALIESPQVCSAKFPAGEQRSVYRLAGSGGVRQGSYFPEWLLERRNRPERAATSVVATCYLAGVSTRRLERLVESLGVTRLSKSQVSVMAAELEEQV